MLTIEKLINAAEKTTTHSQGCLLLSPPIKLRCIKDGAIVTATHVETGKIYPNNVRIKETRSWWPIECFEFTDKVPIPIDEAPIPIFVQALSE